MCVETIQTFTTCHCTIHRHNICESHISLTHRQLTTTPCPSLTTRYVQTTPTTSLTHGPLGCASPTHCPGTTQELYHFDNGQAKRKERIVAFAELRGVDERARCWDGRLREGWRHGCGMGRGWDGGREGGSWRHLSGVDLQVGKRAVAKDVKGKREEDEDEYDEEWSEYGRKENVKVPKIKVEEVDDGSELARVLEDVDMES
ncbi:uncharacterized protein LY89DRAFT_738639 [Mollisia scopiformis]|uniref:Uncharacterized protein n=1 Tax=Mollisia scopiformis TaxID=149040 RepID=A0A194WVL8_MOLSC|nr:uncharacterized protein LY89DRAFT_738639 [Mollisia scopiformis]KUJ12013.1 hypothetical protein LY89DRAFT_738639 [Mollisia scopiformis]